jgi:hypothetical protein
VNQSGRQQGLCHQFLRKNLKPTPERKGAKGAKKKIWRNAGDAAPAAHPRQARVPATSGWVARSVARTYSKTFFALFALFAPLR